jgi:hypothetical protein
MRREKKTANLPPHQPPNGAKSQKNKLAKTDRRADDGEMRRTMGMGMG